MKMRPFCFLSGPFAALQRGGIQIYLKAGEDAPRRQKSDGFGRKTEKGEKTA